MRGINGVGGGGTVAVPTEMGSAKQQAGEAFSQTFSKSH